MPPISSVTSLRLNSLSRTQLVLSTVLLGAAAVFVSFGLSPLPNVLLLPVFGLLLFLVNSDHAPNKMLSILLWGFTLVLGLGLAVYRPSAFSYPLVWASAELYPGGKPFQLFINTSKLFAGYLVIIWLLEKALEKKQNTGEMKARLAALSSIIALLTIGYGFGVDIEVKLPEGLLYFIAVNLLVTVIAEEAFFRLLVQSQLTRFFPSQFGVIFSIFFTTALFALSHAGIAGKALYLYLIAGLIYSLVYWYSGRFYLAVLTHFGTNLGHFIFFQYPLPF